MLSFGYFLFFIIFSHNLCWFFFCFFCTEKSAFFVLTTEKIRRISIMSLFLRYNFHIVFIINTQRNTHYKFHIKYFVYQQKIFVPCFHIFCPNSWTPFCIRRVGRQATTTTRHWLINGNISSSGDNNLLSVDNNSP